VATNADRRFARMKRSNVSGASLRTKVPSRMPAAWTRKPTSVIVVEGLPHNATGKVVKPALREKYGA
jgi:acyl-CoA synthetase (AMP-forming)/AMP-acid ligase II